MCYVHIEALQHSVVIVGVIGTATKAIIIYTMIASSQHKNQFLIFDQNIIPLCSSLLMTVIFTLKLYQIQLCLSNPACRPTESCKDRICSG